MSDFSGAESFLDPDASRDYLRSWKQDVDRRAERGREMAAQMQQLRATAKDDNELAEVTVDSSGVLVDLVLSERMYRQDPQVVSRAVLAAAQKARVKVAAQAAQVAADTMGPESMSAQVIAGRMQELLERPDREAR